MLHKIYKVTIFLGLITASVACSIQPTPSADASLIEVKSEGGEIIIPPGTVIKIGVSSVLSGGYAIYGQDMLNGVNLAIDTFGKLKGFDVMAVGGDDRCESAPGLAIAQQFSADPAMIGVVGPMCSGVLVATSTIYRDSRLMVISPSSTSVHEPAQGFNNIFRIQISEDLYAQAVSDFLFHFLRIKSLAILHDQSVDGTGIAETLKVKFEKVGGKVNELIEMTLDETGFATAISAILVGKPEAVFVGGLGDESVYLLTQLRKSGFSGVFFGPIGINSKTAIMDSSGRTAEGAYIAIGEIGGATGYEDFNTIFIEKYGNPIAYGPNSYDAAMILLKAADMSAKLDKQGNLVIGRNALAEAVRMTSYYGITGFLQFTNSGDLGVATITIFQVQNNDLVLQKTYNFGR